MGAGIWPFFGWENGISCTGAGTIQQQKQYKMGMGLRFEQGRHSDDWICAVGRWDFVKISARKWEKDPPPPPFRTLHLVYTL